MNHIRLTATDGNSVLVDTTEVLYIKESIDLDQVYNTEKRYCTIYFRSGATLKVSNKLDDVEEMIDQLTQW